MQDELKKRIQLVLVAGILLAAARTAYIFYERRSEADLALQQEKERQRKKDTLDPDYYVSLRKFYAYDLAGAQELAKAPVWVRTGYSAAYYPFDPYEKHPIFKHEAGLLLPLEKLQITKVVAYSSLKPPPQRQIMAVYVKEGKQYVFPIGVEEGGNFTFYVNEMLFLDDPHELYKHWPPDVWDAIGKHEIRPGMNELQADCAIGLGLLEGSGLGEERVLHYPNGGAPLTVTYRKGKAVEIKPGG